MRVLLSDEGEGWRTDAPRDLPGRVVGQAAIVPGDTYLKVQFDSPLELQGRYGPLAAGWRVTVYVGAWVKPHLMAQAIGPSEPISVYMWLVDQQAGWGDPPETLPDLWARCAVLA